MKQQTPVIPEIILSRSPMAVVGAILAFGVIRIRSNEQTVQPATLPGNVALKAR